MKKLCRLLLLLICLCSISTYAQKRKVRPLTKEQIRKLEKTAQDDPVYAYVRLADHYKNVGFEKGEKSVSEGKNLKKAKSYLDKALDQAKKRYEKNKKNTRNPSERRANEPLLKREHARVLYKLGTFYDDLKDYTLTKKYYVESSEKGYSFAYFNLGRMYQEGKGVSVDYQKAISYFTDAYKLGRKSAKRLSAYQIGMIYLEQQKDAKNAILWLERALKNSKNGSKIQKRIDQAKALKEESINTTDDNTVIDFKKGMYRAVRSKTKQALAKLEAEFAPIKQKQQTYESLMKQREVTLSKAKKENASLKKPKSEFETQQEYSARKSKYTIRINKSTREIDARIAEIFKPYKTYARKNYTAKQAMFRAYSSQKKKVQEKKQTLNFINERAPETRTFQKAGIVSMDYIAEQEKFKVVIDFRFVESKLRKKLKKTYYVKVPRYKAESFKKNQERHQYFYFLQDLQAIIASDGTYAIEPIHTWYTKLNCEEGDKKAVLIVNNQRNTTDVQTYLETTVTKDPEFIKAVARLKKSYLKDYARNIKAVIYILFDKNGNYRKIQIEYTQGRNPAGINGDRNGDDKQGSWKGDLFYSVSQAIKKRNIRVDPPTKQCEPQKSEFMFKYVITPK